MNLIKYKNKKSGRIYVYEDSPKWDNKIKNNRPKRKLIGYLNEETGEILPTRGRAKNGEGRKVKPKAVNKENTNNSIDLSKIEIKSIGLTHFFNEISHKLNIVENLKEVFPKDYKKILSLSYYRLAESENSMYMFEFFNEKFVHPYNKNIPPSTGGDLLKRIKIDDIYKFFKLQIANGQETMFIAADTTSVSTYSKNIEYAEWGYNKEHDCLEQVNILSVFGQTTKLPCFFSIMNGSVRDVKALVTTINDLKVIKIQNTTLVLDAGFYSVENLRYCNQHKIGYIIRTRTSVTYIKEALDKVIDDIKVPHNRIETGTERINGVMVPIKNPDISNKINYVYFYFNEDIAKTSRLKLDDKLVNLKEELDTNSRKECNENLYKKFFYKDGKTYRINKEMYDETIKYYGVFALVSSKKYDTKETISIYRKKDVVEKGFTNTKGPLDLRRFLVESNEAVLGKYFIAYVSLIVYSFVINNLKELDLVKKYTIKQLFKTLEQVLCTIENDKIKSLRIIQAKHIEIYKKFGIELPNNGLK